MPKDWFAWHEPYDQGGSSLQQRLALVQGHIRTALDQAPTGPVRLISMAAGQGRDVLPVLAEHPRRAEVRARLVELDPRNVAQARTRADAAGLTGVEVIVGDAGTTDAYRGAVPADVVLACGIFGNVVDADIATTVAHLPTLCRAGGTVVWTRYPREDDLLDRIDGWFVEAGFTRVVLETGADGRHFGVGVHRLAPEPAPFCPGQVLFRFLDDPDPTGRRSG